MRITHLSKHRANEPDPSSAIYFHGISQQYECIEPIKMLNDCVDFKEAVFSSLCLTSREFIYWCVEASGFINPCVYERVRERYREPKRA